MARSAMVGPGLFTLGWYHFFQGWVGPAERQGDETGVLLEFAMANRGRR